MQRKNNYLELLDDSWKLHLKEREEKAPTVISTFAGCGGSSLGYSMAGFRELLAVEWDDNAVATFKLNFPDVPVFHGDIAKLSVDRVFEITGLKEYELDVLDGSPPCQGFSTAGKRLFDDDRNQLFRAYVRLLRGLKPKVFVIENVSGMVKGIMKFIFVEILKELKSSGYSVSARLLNAMYFNVPQSRQRMIFIGVREDLGIEPSHPIAESLPIAAIQAIPNDYQALSSIQDLKESEIKKTWQMYRVLLGKIPPKHFGLVKLQYDKPSPTIIKDCGNTSTGLCHPIEIRKLTIPEIKRLSSFHDDFKMIGKYRDKWARIGNSVPPLFMKAIALHIRKYILCR